MHNSGLRGALWAPFLVFGGDWWILACYLLRKSVGSMSRRSLLFGIRTAVPGPPGWNIGITPFFFHLLTVRMLTPPIRARSFIDKKSLRSIFNFFVVSFSYQQNNFVQKAWLVPCGVKWCHMVTLHSLWFHEVPAILSRPDFISSFTCVGNPARKNT